MKRTTKKLGKKAPVAVVRSDDELSLTEHFAEQDHLLLPMLELIDTGKQTIASVMNEAGRAVAELLLKLSAQQIAGAKRPGRHEGDVLWHGSQGGQICLLERKLKVKRPRLRTRGRGGREVEIPLYERLRNDLSLCGRMSEILLNGVST